MTITRRDKRALLLLGLAIPLVLLLRALQDRGPSPKTASRTDSIAVAEKRLERARRHAAGVPGREQVLKQVTAELAEREKGVLAADTAPQAQAQLIEVVRRVAKAQNPPIEFGTTEVGRQVARLGEDYGEVQVAAPFTGHIEDLLNFLADLTRQPEAIATTDIKINGADPKQKTISVRLTISGIVPRRLVPEKKGAM